MTSLDSHISLRLKSSYSNTGWSVAAPHPLMIGLPLLVCAALPVLLARQFCGGCNVIWIGMEENFFPRWRKNPANKNCCVFFPHRSDSWCNSRSTHASAVWVLKDTYPSYTPECSDVGLNSNASSTAKEQTEGITNCDMKIRIITHLGNLPRLVWLWLPVALVHEHAVKQLSCIKLDINQEHPEKIGHDLIRLLFMRVPVLTSFTPDGCLFSCAYADWFSTL